VVVPFLDEEETPLVSMTIPFLTMADPLPFASRSSGEAALSGVAEPSNFMFVSSRSEGCSRGRLRGREGRSEVDVVSSGRAVEAVRPTPRGDEVGTDVKFRETEGSVGVGFGCDV